MSYTLRAPAPSLALAPRTAYLLASGDLRESANVAGWPTQVELEAGVTRVLEQLGWRVILANEIDPTTGHGFISSQRMGLDVFARIPPEAPLIVAEAVWQYSHHVLAGLRTHRGPTVVALPDKETQRRKNMTSPEWPSAHVVLHGVSRDQFMGRHKANHVQLVYAPDAETADPALLAKAAMLDRIGITVSLVGEVNLAQ